MKATHADTAPKRNAYTLTDDDDELAPETPSTKRRKTQRSVAVSVEVPRTPPSVRSAGRPLSTPSRAVTAIVRVPYHRQDGRTIWITPRQMEKTQQGMVPVPEDVAHPPVKGLLFRHVERTSSNRYITTNTPEGTTTRNQRA